MWESVQYSEPELPSLSLSEGWFLFTQYSLELARASDSLSEM